MPNSSTSASTSSQPGPAQQTALGEFPGTRAADRVRVLMIGSRLGVANTTQAMQSHCRADLLPVRNIKGHEMTAALERLARRSYRLLLIDLPHRSILELDNKPSWMLERLEKCVRAQQDGGGDTLLLAPWHDAVWSSPAVRRVAQQFLQHQTRLNWCRFQLRPSGESGALSDRSNKLLSSFKMPALNGRCAHSRAFHRRSWRITDDDPEQAKPWRLHLKQRVAFSQALIHSIKGALGHFAAPAASKAAASLFRLDRGGASAQSRDSVSESQPTSAFPTETRMRAQLRENGNLFMLFFLNSPLEGISIHSSIGLYVFSMRALWALLSNMEPGADVVEVGGGQ